MKTYLVTGPSALFADGTLRLTPDQARARASSLTPQGKDRYAVKAPVVFKRGEVVGYDGEPSRALLQDLDEVEQKRRRKAAEDDRSQAEALGLKLPDDMKPEDIREAVKLASRAAEIAAKGESATDPERAEALQIDDFLSTYKA